MAGPAQSPNRRLYYRQPMYLRINLRIAGVRVAVPATLIDISGGGCQIHARTMVKPRAGIEFELPRAGQSDLRITGIIKKVTYAPEDRIFRYSIQFETLEAQVRDELLRFVIEEQRRAISGTKVQTEIAAVPVRKLSTRLRELRTAYRVEINVAVKYSIGDSPAMQHGTAIDLSTGGLRLILDQVLRQEWLVTLRFTLPNETLKALAQSRGNSAPSMRPFNELKLVARPLPGVKELRGRYVQSLTFINPEAAQTDEISRFVQAARLTAIRK